MPFGPLDPGPSIGGELTDLCSVRLMGSTQGALGDVTATVTSTIPAIPCNLQTMSTARTMLYKGESQQTLYDLYLPSRRENGAAIVVPVGTEFEIDSVMYRSVGEGLDQTGSGIQRVPVERVER